MLNYLLQDIVIISASPRCRRKLNGVEEKKKLGRLGVFVIRSGEGWVKTVSSNLKYYPTKLQVLLSNLWTRMNVS